MFGGGRGGGGGGGRGGGGPASKRASFPPPPPPNRPTSRLSQPGGSSDKSSLSSCSNRPSAAAAAGGGVEETFSLVSGRNSNSFAVIVKLVPGQVDELRKVEAEGGAARIKFDPSGVGPSGNVIDIGGKEFKFTWSSEKAGLCDIFEEQQSGEDGNGLLLQSGSSCRKMNVQRILDESTTNHVKMRSVEAEQKLKSRKAIVLDHGNPSMLNQLKQMAAAESTPWKLYNQKKASPLKKQKIEAPQVVAPASTKPTFNSVPASTVAKGRISSSPLPSPPEQSVPMSTYGTGSIGKSHHSTERIVIGQMKSKESAVSAEKEIPARVSPSARDTSAHKVSPSVHKGKSNVTQMDLQSMLITQLKKNPKGTSLKALEKAAGNTFLNSATSMDPILKKIATSHGRGRYFLKPGLDLESIKKLPSESGSSPDDNHQHDLLPQDRHDRDALGAKLGEGSLALQSEGEAESNSNVLEELNMSMKTEVQHQSPDLFGDKKVTDNCKGPAGSSSNSGSESDSGSESSDSETESGSRSQSRSRSKSPVASGSGSSSESESDDSSNSKEGSDEDVDIMTSDDDKEGQQNLAFSEPAFSGSPDAWRSARATHETEDADVFAGVGIEGHVCNDVEIGGHESGAFEVEKGMLDEDKNIDMVRGECRVHDIDIEVPAELDNGNTMQDRETLIGELFGSNENTPGESFRHELPDASEKKPKPKSKRGSEANFDEKSKRVKRGQTESLFADHGSGGRQLADSPHNMQIDNNSKGPIIQMNQADREANIHLGSQKACNQTVPKKADSEIQQSGKVSSDADMHNKGNEKSGRSKHAESSGRGRKSSGKGSQMHEDSQFAKGKSSADPVLVNNYLAEKKLHKKARESNSGGRKSASSDSHSKKQGEILGKPIDDVPALNAHTGSSPADADRSEIEKVSVVKTLHRELSELEQGELREPFDETPVKLQFERNGSFKHTSDHGNPSLSKGKPVEKKASDTGRPSPNFSADFKIATEHNDKGIPRSRNKVAQPMPQQFPGDDVEAGSQSNKLAESSGKLRHNGTGIKQGIGNDDQGDGFKKALVGVQQPHDSKSGLSHSTKESKMRLPKRINDLVDGRMDTLSEGNNSAPRKRESSSEEDSSYSKYDKEVPEIKGQIKDFSQYKEYVQEYREKYDSYCTLNKILENYRNEFQNLGKDLESAKGKDMERYHKILVQLKESYCWSGPNHKRLKKIFVVLHEELKNLKQRIKDFAVSYI